MASDEVKHDYHLVEPSAWPIVGSIGTFLMAVGAIAYFQTLKGAPPLFGLLSGPWILILGALILGYTFIGWWRDVVKESVVNGDHTPIVKLGLRYGMILFIASEVMFFVAWFWAYFDVALFPADPHQVLRSDLIGHVWPPAPAPDGSFRGTFDPWHLPLLNTLIVSFGGTIFDVQPLGLIEWITIIAATSTVLIFSELVRLIRRRRGRHRGKA